MRILVKNHVEGTREGQPGSAPTRECHGTWVTPGPARGDPGESGPVTKIHADPGPLRAPRSLLGAALGDPATVPKMQATLPPPSLPLPTVK